MNQNNMGIKSCWIEILTLYQKNRRDTHGKELQQYKQFKQKHKFKEQLLFFLCGHTE